MDMKRVSRTVGLIVVCVAVFFGWKLYSKSQASEETKKEAKTFIVNMPGYAANTAYYDSLLEFAHPTAFDASYSMGGRRRAAKFDVEKYFDQLLSLMIGRAEQDKRPEVMAALAVFRAEHRQNEGSP